MLIDGSRGEGGGQMLRSSLALSCITGQPLEMEHVRANRPKPGLARQHLKAVELLSAMADAEVSGASEGSQKITFAPKALRGGEFRLDVGTAGSITLILQAAIPAALLSPEPTKLLVTGGTDVNWSPTMDYLRHAFIPACGLDGFVEVNVVRRGYYPRGGGEVEVLVEPCKGHAPLVLGSEGTGPAVFGFLYSSGLPEHVLRRMEEAARAVLGMPLEISRSDAPAASPGCGITLLARYQGGGIVGAASVGEKGVRAEEVGARCAKALLEEMRSGACADVHLGDQLLLPLALWGGRFTCRELSLHAKTNIEVIEAFLGHRFSVSERCGLIYVEAAEPYIT